ncbi:NRAMP metal transporter [Cymbomonas tetramitiformis]|uniref:NRAMP metal transporter n=1 Tax=Cymbomonas tetramitiformis TaxID=36881 RepID=A0AAE0BEY2_9CHLO|nr:NRAMP metal transporter [Cymbomonas tetramitiformis]
MEDNASSGGVDNAFAPDELDEPTYGQAQAIDVRELGEASRTFSWKKLWAFAGPGWLMSIAYLDPGNIESDLQTGAQTKYMLLWVLFWATFLGLVLQLLSARLGVVTGKHLAQHCRTEYPDWARISLWLMTEFALIGSDIQEVLGSAIAFNILSDGAIPLWAGVIITAADCFSFLFLESFGIRKLETFFAVCLIVMAATFGQMYISTSPNQLEVTKGTVIFDLDNKSFNVAVGMIGAVIMPHNIYLHSALVQSRKIDHGNTAAVKEADMYNKIESTVALFCSFIINLFVVSVFAHNFSEHGVYYEKHHEEFPDCFGENIGLLNTAGCFQDVVGNNNGSWIPMKYIWGFGLLAAGQTSTMTGTYAGQFVMQGFLDLKIKPWQRVLLTRSVALGPTLVVALTVDHATLDTANEWLNILQSVQLPFALVPVIYFTSQEQTMHSFVNSKVAKSTYAFISLLIVIVNIYLVLNGVDLTQPAQLVPTMFVGIMYVSFVGYLTIGPKQARAVWCKVTGKQPDEREDGYSQFSPIGGNM